MIALLDYGSGNLRSVEKALKKVGADVRVTQTPEGMRGAQGVVLPGVGAFDDCVNAMGRQELLGATREWIGSGKPFLGICVGYQALFEGSEEFNSCAAGLGIFQGKVVRFPQHDGLKVPQIGWNQLDIAQPNCPLYKDVPSGSYVYFVHSFFPKPVDESIVATRPKPPSATKWATSPTLPGSTPRSLCLPPRKHAGRAAIRRGYRKSSHAR